MRKLMLAGGIVAALAMFAALGSMLSDPDAGSVARGVARAEDGFIAPTVAVLDLELVLDGSNRRVAMEKEIKESYEKKLAALEALRAELRGIEAELQLLKPGSEEYKQVKKRAGQKQSDLEVDQKQAGEEIEAQRGELFKKLLDEIRRATEEYAAEHRIDLVLQRKLTLQPDLPAWEAVLFANGQLDISKAILEFLNRKS